MSTVFKQLATANLFSCGKWWLFCWADQTARYSNHGDAALCCPSLRQGKPLHSACRDSVSTEDFSGTVCFSRPQREAKRQ
ncbi:hypothetical protein ILYODFUR_038979 [Ilyodon furcidens]|uniref:Secreted protein n=1 Tax=Ilyodon furcidens TaxID=33524 RepID=A0ABV0UQJ2_9TELE